MTDILSQLRSIAALDPLFAIALCVSLLLWFLNVIGRRGGVDPRFTIALFSGVATLASAAKLLVWIVQTAAQAPAVPPSGTDLLLLIGGLLVIYQVVQGSIADSMRSKSDDPSLLGRFVSWVLGTEKLKALPEFLRTNLGLERRSVKGEIGDGKSGVGAASGDEAGKKKAAEG